ncbi:MAG: helix-turn-helix XRE-family like protein [Caudoviricetes sp.]|nr:MAG: helix-turn-helix XRE-family like protein [Caudoviricetes sp.]
MQISEMKIYMKQNKITYDELSDKSGIPIGTIKSIFSGRTPNPRVDTVQAIERALGLGGLFTADDYANGVLDTKKVSITADEEDILDKSREVIEKLGTKGKDIIIEFCDIILKNFESNH